MIREIYPEIGEVYQPQYKLHIVPSPYIDQTVLKITYGEPGQSTTILYYPNEKHLEQWQLEVRLGELTGCRYNRFPHPRKVVPDVYDTLLRQRGLLGKNND
jgi:hypothetical protein